MDPCIFEHVVESLYTGELREIKNAAMALELLEASGFLQIERAEMQCREWIISQTTSSNCVSIWVGASRLDCADVREKALATAGKYLAEVAHQEAFLTMSYSGLLEFARDDNLTVRAEQLVYEAVINWVRFDVESRSGLITGVLSVVRLALLSATYLNDVVLTEPLIAQNLSASALVSDVLGSLTRSPTKKSVGAVAYRKRLLGAHRFIVVGGRGLKSVESYDTITQQWKAYPDMTVERLGCGVSSVNGAIYLLGGRHGGANWQSAERYDPAKMEWRALPDMSTPRSSCGACAVDGLVYVLGGSDGHSRLKSAEYFDPAKNEWYALPDMKVRRKGCGVASLGQVIYVVGGIDSAGSWLRSAECFDTVARQWRSLPDMSVERQACGVACVAGLVYVTGGRDMNYSTLRSAECYDPLTDQWQPLPEMCVERYEHGSKSVDGLIYVVGGHDGRAQLKSAECYDPETRQWKPIPDMSVPRAYCGAAAALVLP
jgi:N-acetylneuraminic acid mutarotase